MFAHRQERMGEVGWVVDELTGFQTITLIPCGDLDTRKNDIDLTCQQQQQFFLFVRMWWMRTLALG